jgi:hypothetical protein
MKKEPMIPKTGKAPQPKQRTFDIKTAPDADLKAAAYDEMLLLQRCQNNIQAINQELAQRAQQGRAVVRPEK